jgi:hypothetical protein
MKFSKFRCYQLGGNVRITNEPLENSISIRAKGKAKSTYIKIAVMSDYYHPAIADITLDEKEYEILKETFKAACDDFERRKALPEDEDD